MRMRMLPVLVPAPMPDIQVTDPDEPFAVRKLM